MANELQLWTINGSNGEVASVEPRNRTDTEKLLEDVIAKQPNMLMPGLNLVGRQTRVAGGNLDLLGVDPDGRLIVFELKRGTLTRDAVTQVIDYASDLEARDSSDLSTHIAERSGAQGIDRIDDFGEWYLQRFGKEIEEQDLKPIRMALVGLGVDDNTTRIVKYLADQGVRIELLTFHAYEHEGKTLLVRHVEMESVVPERAVTTPSRRAERVRSNEERIRAMEISFWDDALAGFRGIGSVSEHVRIDGWAYGRPKLELPNHESSFTVYQSVRAIERGKIRVTFFPIAVHLCKAQFEVASESIHFMKERPSNAPPTNDIDNQWYCVLDEAGWREHKDTLLALASSVYTAWDEAHRTAA